MKPLNNNNSLGAILTFGVPTAVILLGLFWLLRRKREQDEDDDEDARAVKGKPLTGDASEKKKDLSAVALQDGGDSAVQERDGLKKERKEGVNCSLDLKKDFQQHQNHAGGDQRKSELQSDLSALNYVKLESVSPSMGRPVSAQRSYQTQSVSRNPAGKEIVLESSPLVTSPVDSLQPSVVSSGTCSLSSAAESYDSSQQSLKSESVELPDEAGTTAITERSREGKAETTAAVENSSVEETSMTVTSCDSSDCTSTLPSSSQCSLQSDSSGNVQDAKNAGEEVTPAERFSQAQSSGVSNESSAVTGHLGSDHTTAEVMAPEIVSQMCQASCPSDALPELTSNQSPDVLAEEAAAAVEPEGSESLTKDDEAALQPALTVEQPSDSSQSSESKQPVVDNTESTLSSKEADCNVEDECRSSGACSLQTSASSTLSQTAVSTTLSSVPSSTTDRDSFCSSIDAGSTASKGSAPGEVVTPSPMPSSTSTADVEAVESKTLSKEPTSATQSQGISDTEQNTSTSQSKAADHDDIVGNEECAGSEESNESSPVILSASSTNSNANSSEPAIDNGKHTPKKERSNASGKKTDSKHSPKTSSNQKSASPQSKPAESHSKSKQSSTPNSASGHSSRNRNQSASSEPDGVAVSKASPAAAENGRNDSGSPICDTNSEASNDSGRGGSVGDMLLPSGGDLVHYEFNFPSDLCGRLIGRAGRNINYIKDQSGAIITLSSNPFTPEFQICRVRGIVVQG